MSSFRDGKKIKLAKMKFKIYIGLSLKDS